MEDIVSYRTLEKEFYANSSSDRYTAHDALLSKRFDSDSTFKTGIALSTGELFLAVPRELSIATEHVLRRERRVSALWRALPPIALGAYIRSLIMDEVVYSNQIEGVHSTRKQIEAALESYNQNDDHAPFIEFAKLYLQLTDGATPPASLEDIRSIYDSVVADAISQKDLPGDTLFRSGPVEIINQHGRTIHKGVTPESAIESMMLQWIDLSRSDNIPELYSAILCHFLFGYIHPFYDGNGRTGRYLLALHLSNPLSQPTVLSLSRTIAENKAMYYKAFDTVERSLNHAEGTSFVLMMLELITQAQESLILDLSAKQDMLDVLAGRIGTLESEYGRRGCQVLFYAAQMHLYNVLQETSLDTLARDLSISKPTARRAIQSLETIGILSRTSPRPPRYKLTEKGMDLLGIE